MDLSQKQVAEALTNPVAEIARGVKDALERTPPELVSDIIEDGIMLTGGGALLANLSSVINNISGVNVKIADSPLDCVVLGTGASLSEVTKCNAILQKAC